MRFRVMVNSEVFPIKSGTGGSFKCKFESYSRNKDDLTQLVEYYPDTVEVESSSLSVITNCGLIQWKKSVVTKQK